MSFLTHLLSRFRPPAESTPVDFPDPQSLDDYGTMFPALAERLGSARTAPSAAELGFLRRVLATELPPGNVGRGNLFFLAGVVSALAPKRALEIGTASGASTSVMGSLIAAASPADSAEPLIDTIDVKTHCLFDATRPVGYFIREFAPAIADRVRIHTERDSSFAPELFAPRSLDFAFIDGNHQHPWPLLDALRVVPLMRPQSWILLHDIDHPALAARLGRETGRAGAQWLFDEWPAEKIKGENIGVVRIPESRTTLLRTFRRLAERPFEVTASGTNRYRRLLQEAMGRMDS